VTVDAVGRTGRSGGLRRCGCGSRKWDWSRGAKTGSRPSYKGAEARGKGAPTTRVVAAVAAAPGAGGNSCHDRATRAVG
jgi:hypothetical protein